jgi:hypothetical protein
LIKKDCIILDNARKKHVRYIGKYGFPEARTFVRWFYETLFESVPEDMVVKQSCGDFRCINPEHLVVIPKSEEMRYIVAHYPRKWVSIKLSDEEVRFLLTNRNTVNKKDFAKQKGVSEKYLYAILRGETRKNIYKEIADGRQETEIKEEEGTESGTRQEQRRQVRR